MATVGPTVSVMARRHAGVLRSGHDQQSLPAFDRAIPERKCESVVGVSLNNGGTYTSSTPPTIAFSGGGGTGAAGTAVMYGSGTSWYVLSVTMTNNGSGYTSAPTVTFTGSNQTKAPNAVAEITLSGSTNNQTVLNAAGTGAVVINGSNNSGTGGVILGSGGPRETTVAVIDGNGNAIFDGTLTVAGESVFQSSAEVRNSVDAESDFSLWSGLTTAQKESLTYKDWNGTSQWYMEKDQYNNWELNSAIDTLDHFKAYQNGDDYIDAGSGAMCASITRVVRAPASLFTVATARLSTSVSRQRILSSFLGLPRAAGTTACRSTTRAGSPTPAQLAEPDRLAGRSPGRLDRDGQFELFHIRAVLSPSGNLGI